MRRHPDRQTGAVLLMVLWVLASASVMAAVLAASVRLEAASVRRQAEALIARSETLSAVNCALVELALSRRPVPIDPGRPDTIDPLLRFDGSPLVLSVPAPERVEVRIFDHAGAINLGRLSPQKMQALLAWRLGSAGGGVSELLDAWQDWLDGDGLKRLHGAEAEDYAAVGAPEPRNGPLETVEELLLIRGYREAFAGLNLAESFTVYGFHVGVNPNFASAQTLALIPGIDRETAEAIVALRRQRPLRSFADLAFLLDPARSALARPWFQFASSNFYTIAVQAGPAAGSYRLVVQVRGPDRLPRVLKMSAED